MLDAEWIQGPAHRPDMLLELAAGGWLMLNALGREQLDEEDV
jgi:hypothetical protein